MKLIIFCLMCSFIVSCTTTEVSFDDNSNFKQWAFVTVESVLKQDTTIYYYYGQIAETSLEQINENKLEGFLQIKNIRYINDSDKLEVYEDKSYMGYRVFRISDISRIEYLKKYPILIYDYDELDQSAKIIYKKTKANDLSLQRQY